MKILTQYALTPILFFIIYVAAIINADKNADYMSQLLKALTPTPTGWSNNTHFCKWKGVDCDQSNQVVAIKLASSSLTGTLPPNLNSLSSLTHIDLHNNSLIGPLPCLSDLDLLQTVNLGHNKFTLIKDGCFEFLANLTTLNLSNNLNLNQWVFPVSFRVYSDFMHTIDLEATNMIGPLDSEIFDKFPNLQTIFLSRNNLSGTLPQNLGNSKVRCLRIDNQGALNGFQGTIDVISSMKFLSQAWLHNNGFADYIPNMSNCTYLFDLQLHSNKLYGLVPPSLLTLPSLKNISLDHNNLQGPIPVFHKGVTATWEGNGFCINGHCDSQVMILLEILDTYRLIPVSILTNKPIKKNEVCNNLGWFKCQSGKIVSVDLGNENLTGTIFPAFSNLSSLVNLTLARNYLSGSIPQSLTALPHLQLLDVSYNNLSGQIPKFPSKVTLIIKGNAFLGQGSSKKTLVWIVGTSVSIPIIYANICFNYK